VLGRPLTPLLNKGDSLLHCLHKLEADKHHWKSPPIRKGIEGVDDSDGEGDGEGLACRKPRH